MDVQFDYEAQVHLAAFRSVESANDADRALKAAGIEHTLAHLEPGKYQLADPRLAIYSRAVLGAAVIGAVIGALIGIGLAVLFAGAAASVAIWFAVAGVFGGAIVGSLVGLQVSARYDADVGRTITIPEQEQAFVITTHTTQAGPHGAQLRRILNDAGAAALLDVASYEHRRRATGGDVIVESTGVGGR